MDNFPPQNPHSLIKQLENARFDHAIEVVEGLADKRLQLTTSELARVNNILTGRPPTHDPWRQQPATLTLPSGKTETVSIIENAQQLLREKLHHATELAENGQVIDAAVDIYIGLVLKHLFEDANRRTAIMATHYYLKRYNVPLSGIAIHSLGLGDLREEGYIETVRATIHQMAKFAVRQKSR